MVAARLEQSHLIARTSHISLDGSSRRHGVPSNVGFGLELYKDTDDDDNNNDMPHIHRICTEVTPECPVSATTYGYAPELGSNIFLLVVFGVCTIAQLVLGLKYKLRAFTFAVTVGCLGETVGYAGRIMLHYNAWSDTGFKTEIVCLVLSPSFLAAGIYLTLKHLVIYFGAEKSRIRPGLYTAVFISCDVASILMQAAGGGVAASNEVNLVNIGDHIIVAGISFQVFTMFICLCLAADFGWQVLKHHKNRAVTGAEIAEAREMPHSFRYYAICSAVAFVLIFIRCVYRYALPRSQTGCASTAC